MEEGRGWDYEWIRNIFIIIIWIAFWIGEALEIREC